MKDRLAAAEDLKEDSTAPLNYTYLATQTEGYSATDLQDLVARATHQAAVRAATAERSVSMPGPLFFEAHPINSLF